MPPQLSVGVVQCVEAYARMSELKKAIFLLVAHQCALDALQELRVLFTHFDFRNQGSLSAADLHHVLVQTGMGGLRAERVLHALDRDGDGEIMWTEFIAAAICGLIVHKEYCADAAFATIDWDQKAKITDEDLVKLFAGPECGSQQVWRRRPLLEEILRADTDTSAARHVKDALKGFATLVMGPESASHKLASLGLSRETSATKWQFRKYLCEKLQFRNGDEFHAVS